MGYTEGSKQLIQITMFSAGTEVYAAATGILGKRKNTGIYTCQIFRLLRGFVY